MSPDVVSPSAKPFNAGKNGSVDQFLAANKAASLIPDAGAGQQELQNGAIQAFKEGRPENVQAVLLNRDDFKIDGKDAVADILLKLAGGNDKASDIINLAVAKHTEQGKRSALSYALNDAISRNIGDKSFYEALLKSGANANVENGRGFTGVILANAVTQHHSLSVVKLLHEKGASFDDARLLMQSDKKFWGTDCIESLNAYQEKITGKPAGITGDLSPKVLEIIEQLQQQVKDITERLDRVEPAVNSPQPQETKIVQNKKRYPQVKGL